MELKKLTPRQKCNLFCINKVRYLSRTNTESCLQSNEIYCANLKKILIYFFYEEFLQYLYLLDSAL